MKFSIITCTYNSDKWILKNIKSVCEQSFKDYEHIFIDGFSKDNTLDIINDYRNNYPDKVRLFNLSPSGISGAMNEGIKKSSGDYLIHLHSDDSFFDNKVLEDVANFLDSASVDWIYGKINVVEESGLKVGVFPEKKIFQQNYKSKIGNYFLKFFNFIPHQAVFIKKTVFDKYGYFDNQLSSSMDPDMWLRIRTKTKWCFYDRIISNYCLRSSSVSASVNNKLSNKNNFELVQHRFMNSIEKKVAKFVNFLVQKRNKNYR